MTRLPGAPTLFGLICIAVLWSGGVGAETFTSAQRTEIIAIIRDALKQDPSILRDAVAALQADDDNKARTAAHNAVVASRGALVGTEDPVGGNPAGDATIVEFFDVRCPYCRRMEPVMDQFLDQDHEVRVVYKDLPILGPPSVLGSKALIAAQQQGAYIKMRKAVMQLPPDITLQQIEATATALGLDWPKLKQDMDDPSVQRRIDQNLKLAQALGIQGTPALVIGDDLIPSSLSLSELQKAVANVRR